MTIEFITSMFPQGILRPGSRGHGLKTTPPPLDMGAFAECLVFRRGLEEGIFEVQNE